jgi:hypothetical protein
MRKAITFVCAMVGIELFLVILAIIIAIFAAYYYCVPTYAKQKLDETDDILLEEI